MTERTVHGVLDLQIVTDPEDLKRSPGGQPFMRVTLPDGIVVELTLRMAVSIGALAGGTLDYLEMIGEQPPAGQA